MSKILVIGDVHLDAGLSYGKNDPTTGMNTRLLDYNNTLNGIVDYAITNKIKVVIMVGDIFETRHPRPTALSFFYKALNRLSKAKIKVVIIAGNHDIFMLKEVHSSLEPIKEFNIPNVYIYNTIDSLTIGDLELFLMPYCNRQTLGKDNVEDGLQYIKDKIDKFISDGGGNKTKVAILHMMFENTINSDILDYGTKELILPLEFFKDIDVTICGHIHRPSIVQDNPKIIYSGSMECKDFGEKDHKKTFIVIDTKTKNIEFIPIETRKFVEMEINCDSCNEENINEYIISEIKKYNIDNAVIRLTINVPENISSFIKINETTNMIYQMNPNFIVGIEIRTTSTRQLRNKEITEYLDDMTIFKKYIETQTNVEEGTVDLAVEIMAIVDNL